MIKNVEKNVDVKEEVGESGVEQSVANDQSFEVEDVNNDISITDELDHSEGNDPEIIQLLLENEREALVEQEELLSMQHQLNEEISSEEKEIERLREVLE